MMNKNKTIQVAGFISFTHANVSCPFCGQVHQHGYKAGPRVSHCIKGETGDYDLVLQSCRMPGIFRFLERQAKKIEQRYERGEFTWAEYKAAKDRVLRYVELLNFAHVEEALSGARTLSEKRRVDGKIKTETKQDNIAHRRGQKHF